MSQTKVQLLNNVSGNVGIGTSSPSGKLEINNTGSPNSELLRLVNTQHDTNAQSSSQLKFGITNSLGERNARIEAKEESNNTNDVALDFYTNSTSSTDGETIKMRVTAAGNVGIGTTSPSGASGKVLEINGGSGQARLVFKNDTTGSASTDGQQVFSDGTTLGIQNREAGNITFETNGSERMRIDSSGNVGIGATSMQYLVDIHGASGNAKLNLQRTNGASNGNAYGSIFFSNSAGNSNASIRAHRESDEDNAYLAFQTSSGGTLAERLRIDSTGTLLLGTTSVHNTGKVFSITGADHIMEIQNTSTAGHRTITLRHSRASGGTNGEQIVFEESGGGAVGSIQSNGSSTSYNTSSDYRLKENVVAISDGISRLKTLLPKRFNFIIDETNTLVDGFLAHEVTAVPEAITGTKDAVVTQDQVDAGSYTEEELNNPIYQGIDQSKLVPLLVAALQEEIAKREALETRVAALEPA